MVNGFKERARRKKFGDPIVYLRAHMFDGCCSPWPFGTHPQGYALLWDSTQGVTRYCHVLVCTWVNGPRPFLGAQSRHLCGKGHLQCFNADCMKWGTAKDNSADSVRHGTTLQGARHPLSKLTDEAVAEIRALRGKVTQQSLAEKFGVTQALISWVQTGGGWKHV